MMPSTKCYDQIKAFESLSLVPYRCPAGVWTIGWGHTKGVTKNSKPITRQQAQALLEADVAGAASAVNALVKVALTQNQYDALVSFTLNTGAGNFAASKLLDFLNQQRYAEVPAQIDRWVWATDRETGEKHILPGLVNRRAKERALFEGRRA